MTTLLRVDSSTRLSDSFSRGLADRIEAAWRARTPGGKVVHRDVVRHPLPHIEQKTIEGYYTPAEQMTAELRQATAMSDLLIAELMSCDTLLISAPIYNFSVPSALKAWIDQVVRIGKTFGYDGTEFTGLVTGKRAILALAYGADGYDGALAGFDHLETYLVTLLNFLGIQDVEVVDTQGTVTANGAIGGHLGKLEGRISRLFATPGGAAAH